MELSEQEKATNYETMQHIERVRNLLNECVLILLRRGELHDQSKMQSPEVEIFAEYTPKLRITEYGSDEYKNCLKEMKVALEHHYANNRHHTEFHKNGLNDMNLLDLIEMLCDWKAASERHNNGNIRKSLEINATKYGFSPQLAQIFENTINYLFTE